jgi:hypothetical protein
MHRHGGKWKRLRAPPDNLVAERQRAQHLQGVGAGRLGFRQERGENVGAGMRGRETVALVEFAPGRGGGRIVIGTGRRATEHSCFARRRTFGEFVLRGPHLGLGFGADSRGDVVGQHQRGVAQHNIRNLRRLQAGCPSDQIARCRRCFSARGSFRCFCTQNHFHKSALPLSSCAEP